ncbi:MAG TPA: dynamin family protein [Syntrophomonadaceae bacterium]|nr:dynamin family protein [Syntrophomonadaceae bacterium]
MITGVNMIGNYNNTIFELYGYLVQLRELFRTHAIGADEIQRIESTIQLIQSRNFNVAVVGEFKRGKSSLINAILGLKILPSDVTPATATINRITYGTEPSMTIHYHDGSVEAAELDNIADYVTKLTDEGEKRAALIKEAVIKYPTVICQNHVDIIDTPGLNDNPEMTRVTLDLLTNIDVVLVTISAIAPFSQVEKDLVCRLIKSENIENIVFVITFMDQLDEDEQDKMISFIHKRVCASVLQSLDNESGSEEFKEKSRRVLDNARIYGVSSFLALKSFVSNNREMLRQSRFEAFKNELYEWLTSKQGANIIAKAIKVLRSSGGVFTETCQQRINELEIEEQLLLDSLSVIKDYTASYEKELNEAFQKSEKYLLLCISNINGLKKLFSYLFTEANRDPVGTWQERADIVNAEARKCLALANNDYSGIILNQWVAAFVEALGSFTELRRKGLLIPLNNIKQITGLEVKLAECFERDVMDTLAGFDLPKLKWTAPLLPDIPTTNKKELIKGINRVVDLSVGKVFEDWNRFLISSKNWWLSHARQEVLSSNSQCIALAASTVEEKERQGILLKSSLEKQSQMIGEMIARAEKISEELYI